MPQLTCAPHGHVLTNTGVWSPDGKWIVYDVRSVPERFDGRIIERVQVETGEVAALYAAGHGACCGVVTCHPKEPVVAFIHGPEHPSPDWNYGITRRRGAYVDARRPGVALPLDAMNYAPPFTPGALRGGSHVHVFSADGRRVSFTYEDEVLERLGGAGADLNQRNVGVTALNHPVSVGRHHPRNNDGTGFSVLVTRTVNQPRPGSDEISRAFEEGWIGRNGRSLAFQGMVTARDGQQHAEVFVAELPEDLTQEGDGPLQGTPTRRPAPPRGVTQRRLTFTEHRRHRGIQGVRHWLRSSPDGSRIAFLMKDDHGVDQLWTIPPAGGAPAQLTHNATSIGSTFTWSPDGRHIAHVLGTQVGMTDTATGIFRPLTPPCPASEAPSPLACVFSPDGAQIAYQRPVAGPQGHHPQIFTIGVHPRDTD